VTFRGDAGLNGRRPSTLSPVRLGGVLAGVALAVVGFTQLSAPRGEQELSAAPPTTVAPQLTTTTTGPGTTVRGRAGGTTTAPGPVLTAPPRGGATAGTTAKPAADEWSIRRIVTTVGSFVLGLALLGFVYGRIRSASPPRPPLAPTSD
jgi:hypothetical protein